MGLQFELTKPPADENAPDGDDPAVLQMRLSMAHANMSALLDAEATRQREHDELKGKITLLEGEVNTHLTRAAEAEARASEFRTRLVRSQASRDRLSVELLQIKKEIAHQATRRQYVMEASTMSQSRAVEFLQEKSGEDLDGALRMQHSTICELQSENARLRSEKLEQRRQFKAEIERKDVVIQRLRATEETLRLSMQPTCSNRQQQTSTVLRTSPSGLRPAMLLRQAPEGRSLRLGTIAPRSSNITELRSTSELSAPAPSSRGARAVPRTCTEFTAALRTPRLSNPALSPSVKKADSKKKAQPEGQACKGRATVEAVALASKQGTSGGDEGALNKPYMRLWPCDVAALALGSLLPLISVTVSYWMMLSF